VFEKLRQDRQLREFEKHIQRHGWTATRVGNHASAPSWIYTLGFADTLGQPELILFDVPQDIAGGLLGRAFDDLKAAKLVLVDGKPWVIDGDRLGVWRKVDDSQIDGPDLWFAATLAFRERKTGKRQGLEAFQLVIADEDGLLPWEPGYNEHIRPRQPALYLPAGDYGDTPLSPPERETLRLADERGWAMMLVDGPGPTWSYTVGLTEDAGIPELIAFMPVNYAANILHEAQDHIRRGELVLADGLRWETPDLKACWRQVHESQYLGLNVFRLAKLRHERRTGRREALTAYQLFLPDHDGLYPWESGCHEIMRNMQPLLFEPFNEKQPRGGPLAALMRM
jgi:hypothetical protein